MKTFITTSLLLLLTGCGGMYYSGTKPGAGQAEFSNNMLECKMVAQRITGNASDVDIIYGCMQGKGWVMDKPQYRNERP